MLTRYFKCNRKDFVYLKFILEAYEGMNIMSTIDNINGIIKIVITEGFEDDMNQLLKALGEDVKMEEVFY